MSILADLIRLRSQTAADGEGAVADYVAELLRGLGAEVTTPEVLPGRCNVIGTLRGRQERPRLVFNTHMDTVPAGDGWSGDPFVAERREGAIYGRGAVDAKGPLACMLVAFEHAARRPERLRGEFVLATVVDEEIASRGARHATRGLVADYAVIGEPTDGAIGLAQRGSIRPVIVVEGKAAHSSRPEEGLNAIFKMARVLAALERYGEDVRRRSHPLVGTATATVTLISGGTGENVVPDRCEITLDRRLVPGERDEEVLREVQMVLDGVAAADPSVQARIERLLPTTGGPAETPATATIARLARTAAARHRGRDDGFIGLTGACDMVHFREAGAECIILGPGDLGVAHRPDEYVKVADLVVVERIYTDLIEGLLGS